MAARKAKRNIKLGDISTKAMGAAVVKYREMRKAGQVPAIAAFEKLSKFYGKKGQVLKRETRYQTQLNKLQGLIKEAQGQYGKTPGKSTIQKKAKEISEKQKKAAATYAKHHGAKDNRFKRVAREQTAKYGKMVDVFASDTYEKLKSQAYGIGSDVVEKLIEDGWDPEEAEEFLKQVMETMNDIPAEARNLADQDTFWMNIKDMSEIIQSGGIDADNMKDVLAAYMTTDDREGFQQALENYVEIGEDIPFGEIWEELQYYDDKGSADNMQEVIDELRGE